jgi:hypothetical protein
MSTSIGGVCSMHGRENLNSLRVNKKIIEMGHKELGRGTVNWIHFAQERFQWEA